MVFSGLQWASVGQNVRSVEVVVPYADCVADGLEFVNYGGNNTISRVLSMGKAVTIPL